jgi:hypothetical protein
VGFCIENNCVYVDHKTRDYCETHDKVEPIFTTTKCGLVVYSIFLRRSNKTLKKDVGDNCPMIYALKKQQGLYTTLHQAFHFSQSSQMILNRFLVDRSYDCVVPMPSSSNISMILAKRVIKVQGGTGFIGLDLLVKVSLEDALKQVIDHENLPYEVRSTLARSIRAKLKLGDSKLSLKEIKPEFRKYLTPIKRSSTDFRQSHMISPQKILLVDDLLSTGVTLIHAKQLLQSMFPHAEIEALCLFSALNGKIKA